MHAIERLFVSLNLPSAGKDALAKLQEEQPGVVWGIPEQFHLTMRFLGDVETALAARIEDEFAKIQVEPFLLPLGGIGRFPPRGPVRVLWAGMGSGHTRLHQLRKKIDDATLTAGWRGELRNFEPHITLGRVCEDAEPAPVDQWLKNHRDFEGLVFRVTTYDLMSSKLRPGGAEHTLKRRFSLVDAK
ncbi:MAG: RNA 2',3'-cyclic phosphodiesterase [Nibricoccus sp.]